MMARVGEAKVRADLDATIRDHPAEEGAYLVSWVVVAEWLLPDGTRELAMSDSEAMTPWLRKGMLTEAMDEGGWG